MQITSRNNPRIKELVRLAKDPDGELTLCEGYHLCAEAFGSGVEVTELIVTPEAAEHVEGAGILSLALEEDVPVLDMTRECYEKISSLKSPEGMAAVVRLPHAPLAEILAPDARLLVADGVQDPGNAGALARVAEAAGCSGLILIGGVDPRGGKFLRAAMGSAFRLPCIRCEKEDFIAQAREANIKLIAAVVSPQSMAYEKFTGYRAPVALCVGGEGNGLSAEIAAAATASVFIPLAGAVESLNVAVAAGILLYHARRFWPQPEDADTSGN